MWRVKILSKPHKESFLLGRTPTYVKETKKFFVCIASKIVLKLCKSSKFWIKTFESDSTHAYNGNDLCRAFTRRYKTVQCTDIRDGYCIGSNFILCWNSNQESIIKENKWFAYLIPKLLQFEATKNLQNIQFSSKCY